MSVPAAYAAVVIIWSTTPLGIAWSSETVSPTMAVLLRMAIALVLGLLIMWPLKMRLPWHKQAWKVYAYSSLGIYGGMTLCYLAASHVASGVMSLLFGLSPVLSGLLAQRILAEPKFGPVKSLAMLICFAGLAFVFADSLTLTGYALVALGGVLIAVFFFSLSGVLVKSVELDIHPMATTVGALLFCTPMFALTWWVADGSVPVNSWGATSLWSIVYLGIFGSLLGFIAYFHVLQKLRASTVALITLITPVIALMLGAWLNGEQISANIAVGAGCVLLGLGLFQRGGRQAVS